METSNKFSHENDAQKALKECSVNQHSYKELLKAAYRVLINMTFSSFQCCLKIFFSKSSQKNGSLRIKTFKNILSCFTYLIPTKIFNSRWQNFNCERLICEYFYCVIFMA